VTRARTIRRFLLPIMVLTAAACGGDADDGGDGEQDGGQRVGIERLAFQSDDLAVDVGATVTWTNEDPGAHTVTSGTVEQTPIGTTEVDADGAFASGEIERDATFSFTFDEPGTYSYFCEIHPATMRGEIQVR